MNVAFVCTTLPDPDEVKSLTNLAQALAAAGVKLHTRLGSAGDIHLNTEFRRAGGTSVIHPKDVLRVTDDVIVFGSYEDIERLKEHTPDRHHASWIACIDGSDLDRLTERVIDVLVKER